MQKALRTAFHWEVESGLALVREKPMPVDSVGSAIMPATVSLLRAFFFSRRVTSSGLP